MFNVKYDVDWRKERLGDRGDRITVPELDPKRLELVSNAKIRLLLASWQCPIMPYQLLYFTLATCQTRHIAVQSRIGTRLKSNIGISTR